MNQPYVYIRLGFPGGSNGKESACNAEDAGSILGSERSPGEGNGNPVQYSCLENPMDREAWQATVHGVTKSWLLHNMTYICPLPLEPPSPPIPSYLSRSSQGTRFEFPAS